MYIYCAHTVNIFPDLFPCADNFVLGSADLLEGLIERINFEPNFDMRSNPGITLEQFKL